MEFRYLLALVVVLMVLDAANALPGWGYWSSMYIYFINIIADANFI